MLLAAWVAGLAVVLAAGPFIGLPGAGADTAVPTVTITTVNWGRAVSLLDPGEPAWAQAATGTNVVATVELHGLALHQWELVLTTPTSYGLPVTSHCEGEELVTPTRLRCSFQVSASSGINPIELTAIADGRTIIQREGILRAGSLSWEAGYEVLDAAGTWAAVSPDHPVTLIATTTTALRYVVLNRGTIPLRLRGGCQGDDGGIVIEGDRAVCPLRGVRPAQSLARDYVTHVRLEDAAGDGASFDISTAIRTFAGSFSLASTSVPPHGIVVVSGAGLPTAGSFAMQFRLDSDQAVLGTSITRNGTIRLSFLLPSAAKSGARLNVVHEGVVVASLPFTVGNAPPDDKRTTPPVLAILIGALLGAAVAGGLTLRGSRSLSGRGK